jgi:integrase
LIFRCHFSSFSPFFSHFWQFWALWAQFQPNQIMTKKRTIDPVFDKTRKRWKLDVPASVSDTGKRFRAWFDTRQAARDFIGESTTEAAVTIPPSLASDADTARQRLEAAGLEMTLAEMAAEFIAASKALGGAGTLLDAAEALHRTHAARVASKPLGEAVEAFLVAKDGSLRPRTEGSYRYTLENVLESLHATPVSDITTSELVEILGHRKPTSRAVHVRNLRVFWNWAAKAPRNWASLDTVQALEFRVEAGEADIEILRTNEVKALLGAAEGYASSAAAAFAVAVFAGVRSAELERLTWADIGEDYIEIGRSVAKRGKRRMIPISKTLRAWLDVYTPADADPDDFMVGSNWAAVSCAVRRLAGWDVSARTLDNPPKPTRGAWPTNAARHTCASILVATGEPLETLIFAFGHSGGHDLLRKHYVGRLTKKEANAILSVGPGGTTIPRG